MAISRPDRGARNRGRGALAFGASPGGGGGTIGENAIFNLPLDDIGSGAVNTTPIFSAGSPTATFTRATVAWTKLSNGLWAQVASGTARSCYLGADTAAGSYGGYFAEGAGTQLVTPTASIRDMTDASWVKGGTLTVAKTGTGIDGVSNSCSRLTGGAVSATNTLFQTLTAAASSRTYSCWIKRVTGTGTINISQNGGSTYTDVTSQINSSTFTRVSLTASVLNAAFGIQVVTNGDVILVDFNQFEAGAVATSPMDATGATRNADVLTYAAANNYSDANGVCYAEIAVTSSDTTFMSNVRFISTSAAGSQCVAGNSGGLVPSTNDGTNSANGSSLFVAYTITKIATRWITGGALNIFQSGSKDIASASYGGSFGTTSIAIGNRSGTGTLQPYSFLKNLRIYSTALSDAQLQVMTT